MKHLLLMLLLVLPAVVLVVEKDHGHFLSFAAEDEDDDMTDDETVDVDGDVEDTAVTGEEEAEADDSPGASPDAETVMLFIKPVGSTNLELPGGKLVEFLVGFTNKGNQDFVLETLDASFRYPMDFTFHIQNFSTIAYNKIVKPQYQATLFYQFVPSEAFAGRPFGLNVNLQYRDMAGSIFREAVYNETVNIIEVEEGLDGETFFLYLFMAAIAVLLLVTGQQLLSSTKALKRSGKKPVVETGTSSSNPNGVDYDWLPKETLSEINKSPKQPKLSPRQRKARRATGSDD